MWQIKNWNVSFRSLALSSLLLAGLLMAASSPTSSRDKFETIEATAYGTGDQVGADGATLDIYEFSTMADKQILIQAFEKGQSQGLATALQKMKAVGRIAISGTLGNDCSFIRMIPTATGRKIIFITNRQIRFAEA